MKTIAAIAFLLMATVSIEETRAIQLNARIQFTDELEKMLTEQEKQEDAAAGKTEVKEVIKKETPKVNATATAQLSTPVVNATASLFKKEDLQEIPMDTESIKAYSSVIADAAEDSAPENPVTYQAYPENK